MTNGEKFLTIYNNLEQFLKKKMDLEEHVPFQQLIRLSSEKYKELYFFRHDLIEYGQLRNAIVHTRDGDKLIAEPYNETVENFEQIYAKITRPKSILEIINNEVFILSPEDTLEKALNIMGEKGFSTIPVYEENIFKGVISNSKITNWLIMNLKISESINCKLVKLSELLKYKDETNVVKFINANTNIYEIRDIYKKNITTKNKIIAMIITKTGRLNEKPLGIITNGDIPKIFENL